MFNFIKNFIFFLFLGTVSFLIIFWFNRSFENQNNTVGENKSVSDTRPENAEFNNVPVLPIGEDTANAKEFSVKTDVYDIVFSPVGGTVSHIFVKPNEKSQEVIDLIHGNGTEKAFDLKFGNYRGNDIVSVFDYTVEQKENETSVIFTRDFTDKNNVPFTLNKKYRIFDGEFMIELTVEILSQETKIPFLSNEQPSYTLEFLPQIGPAFVETSKKNKSGSANYRDFIIYKDEKLKKYSNYERVLITTRVDWVGIESRYFAAIGVEPKLTTHRIVMDKYSDNGYVFNEIFFERKPFNEIEITDTYRFYVGPRVKHFLSIYNSENDNAFGYSGMSLDKAGAGRGIISVALKGVMNFFHNILHIHNWGWVIVLLTIFIKLILVPFSMSQMKSSAAMQKLQPKIKEIQDKYKNNPQKMQAEMANFYRENKINPMKGCLPMILQMLILIPLFNLLRSDYDLFQEPFIWWITDLSSPDSVFTWERNIPLITSFSQNSIRILPILFIVTQLLSMKIMQIGTEQAANKQMKIMMYLLPIIFFFTLYNMPSGLFVYWIVMNILSVIQQLIYNAVKKNNKNKNSSSGEKKIAGKKKVFAK